MDDPTDLSARRTGDGWADGDDDVVRSVRAALGEPPAPLPGQRAPREVLARLEQRAARHQRRRRAVALTRAAAAAAVVVGLGGVLVPMLPPLGGSSASSAGGSAAGAGSSAEGGDSGSALSAPAAAPSASAPDQEGLSSTSDSRAGGVPAVSESSLLQADDVRSFLGGTPADGTAGDVTASGLALGACVDGSAGSVDVAAVWRVDWQAAEVAQGALVPAGVVERVASTADPATAAAAVEALRDDAAACTGSGLEGRGPTAELADPGLAPAGGSAVVLAADGGNGEQLLQVLVATPEGLLVQLQATSPAGGAAAALETLVPVAQAAVQRATGAASAAP